MAEVARARQPTLALNAYCSNIENDITQTRDYMIELVICYDLY